MTAPGGPGLLPVRIRTARARSKARDQLRELLRDTSLIQAVVIACNAEGAWTVLAGGTTGRDMAEALGIGTKALEQVLQHEAEQGGAGAPIRLDDRTPVEPLKPREGRKREPEITTDAEGEMQAPPGEAFLYCAECGASRWYALVMSVTNAPARLACIRCGNEIKTLQILHQEGRA